MKCRICGATLKKDGDICTNCYKELQEEEDLKKDKKECLKVKRKYSIAYEIRRYIEWIMIYIICLVSLVCGRAWGSFILTLLGGIVLFGFLFFFDKRVARATRATFYEKKVRYRFDLWFIHKEKTVKYSDITDISYFQSNRQKRLGLADICIYARGAVPGTTLLNGFQVKDVENATDVVKEIYEIIGTLDY